MTWSREVSLIFLDIINDPEIIIYLMQIAKPTHYHFVLSEAREFHESLRVTSKKRWAMSKELSERGELEATHQMSFFCLSSIDFMIF